VYKSGIKGVGFIENLLKKIIFFIEKAIIHYDYLVFSTFFTAKDGFIILNNL